MISYDLRVRFNAPGEVGENPAPGIDDHQVADGVSTAEIDLDYLAKVRAELPALKYRWIS